MLNSQNRFESAEIRLHYANPKRRVCIIHGFFTGSYMKGLNAGTNFNEADSLFDYDRKLSTEIETIEYICLIFKTLSILRC